LQHYTLKNSIRLREVIHRSTETYPHSSKFLVDGTVIFGAGT
jgi:hypothetical protein